MALVIGTSGWQYRHWRETFYPAGMSTAHWLAYYAAMFDTVEVNNAFYRLPDAGVFARWAETVPDGFTVAVKASSFLTHTRRLRDPAEPVARLLTRARHLGDRLGPILLQLPPTLRVEVARLDETLACFGSSVRVAVEARHESWHCDAVWEVLAARGAAWCLADSPRRTTPVVRTTDWGYVRFHEGRATPHPCYGRAALATWVERIAETWPEGGEVYAYFNNDPCACALRDARRFAAIARHAGLETTKVPGRGAVHLCAPDPR